MDFLTPIPRPKWPPRWRNISGGVTPRVWGALFVVGLGLGIFQVYSSRHDEMFARIAATNPPGSVWWWLPLCVAVGAFEGVFIYAAIYLGSIWFGPLVRKFFLLAMIPGLGGLAWGVLVSAVGFGEPFLVLLGSCFVATWLMLLALCLGQDEFSRPFQPPPSEDDLVRARVDAVMGQQLATSDTAWEGARPVEQIVPLVREVIHAWDPYQVASQGNPAELEPEIQALARLAPQWRSPQDAAEAVSLVFSASFDDAEAFAVENCRDVGKRLFAALDV